MKTKTQLRSLESIGARAPHYYRDKAGFMAHILGDPSKQRTVLINCGWASVPELYTTLAERLNKEGLAVVVLSMRGVGENPLGKSTPSTYIQTSVEDSLYLLSSLNVRELILMPHSTGAQVAMKLVNQLPSEVVLKGCILNAPSIPDTLAGFPDETFLHKVGKFSAGVFFKMVSLGVKEDRVTWFAKFSAKLATWTFRLFSPLMTIGANVDSKAVDKEFWRNATAQSSETLAVSMAALANHSGEMVSQIKFSCPVTFIGYRKDILVSPKIGQDLINGRLIVVTNQHFVSFENETHFGHEVRAADIIGLVRSLSDKPVQATFFW